MQEGSLAPFSLYRPHRSNALTNSN